MGIFKRESHFCVFANTARSNGETNGKKTTINGPICEKTATSFPGKERSNLRKNGPRKRTCEKTVQLAKKRQPPFPGKEQRSNLRKNDNLLPRKKNGPICKKTVQYAKKRQPHFRAKAVQFVKKRSKEKNLRKNGPTSKKTTTSFSRKRRTVQFAKKRQSTGPGKE